MIYLYAKAPQRIRDTGKIFLDDEALETPSAAALPGDR
jgi:hypothetical protein